LKPNDKTTAPQCAERTEVALSALFDFQCEVGRWGRETFGNDVQRREGLVAHLAREVIELAEAHDPEEAADCLILLLGHADVMGYDLLEVARVKMEINRMRTWGKPDRHGIVEHVSESNDMLSVSGEQKGTNEQH